jgi:transketolase
MNAITKDLPLIAKNVAKNIVTLAHKNKASHIGGSLSVLDVLVVLYGKIMKYDTKNPNYESRDRLLYSKGHACLALYATLYEMGFYSLESLNTFTADGSYFTSHVNHKVPGIELSTGSLGHALNVACGIALAGKIKHKKWRVFTIVSDGELDEGSNWEALLFAPHHQLNNLTVIVDYNKIQSFGDVKNVLNLEPLKDKLVAFGWHTVEINGHNHQEIEASLLGATTQQKPTIIIANTIKGNGIPFMENELAWHYKSPSDEQLQQALHYIDNRVI